ncbi:SRPBCC domain-containing protein, partial [Klebsiella pneumoniae]|nr:SRPBCC domain-containing protein [Klebsiella pneumoniae]
ELQQMKKWYFDLASFKAEVGFEFMFTADDEHGQQFVHICKVTEVIPGKKLEYSWRFKGYTGISYVSFELFPSGDGMLLRLTHRDLETFPDT